MTRLQIHGTYFPVIIPFLSLGFCHWLGLDLLEGCPQLVLDCSHTFVHMLGRGTSLGDLCAPEWWGSKSWLGALVCVQTLNNVGCTPSWQIGWHCMHVLFQPDVLASQPFAFSQLSSHFLNHLMRSLHQPIHLGVVRCGLQFLHAEEFTHLATHKVCTPIAQEPGQGPEY